MKPFSALRRILQRPYRTVTPEQAADLAAGGAVLLDVREDAEWRAGHAPGARHIPLGALADRLGELPRNRMIVTVCRSGARSARAAALLARDGREVANLSGGMRAWQHAGKPVVAGKRPGRVI